MTRNKRIIAGTAGVTLVFILAIALFLQHQIRKSFPDTHGSIVLTGLEQSARVARDGFGVPFIAAQNEHDLMLVTGFVHAQDRLWQMDLARRAGEGRLSELFGTATLPFDRMFLTVGIRRTAEKIASAMSAESLTRLEWYAEGVNAYIARSKGKYPVEFDLLGYQPEPWTPVHSIILGRLIAWELNLSWWTDVTYGTIAERVGLERALDLLPEYPASVDPIVPPEGWRSYATLGRSYLHAAQAYAASFGSASLIGGSNAWAVAPARSASGAAMLANDAHLLLQVPSRWYEMQMQMPGLRVRGMSIAGVPVIVAGRNAWIAWGLTNIMADDADFFVEQIDSLGGGMHYRYDGRWEPLTLVREEIPVRGDTMQPFTIRLTRHGPIVTDIASPQVAVRAPYVASMRWTGNDADDQFGAFTRINRARNWDEFTAGVRTFAVPGQNFVYADIGGNIGYWCGVKLPIRPGRNSLLPLPGWDPATEWKGYVPFKELPHLYNPPEGYIATANNKVVDDTYPYHISDLWEPASRIQRLREVLGRKDDLFSLKDFERLQNDAYSEYAHTMVPYLLAAFKDSVQMPPGAERAFEYLRNWHYQFAADDIATAIYQVFLVHLIGDTFADEMGDDLFHDWVMLTNIPLRVTARLLEKGTSPWFDDIRTPALETRDDIIRRSVNEALAELRVRFGDDTKNWRWGSMHTVTLRHPLERVKSLERIFNVGPYAAGGASTALVSFEYDFTRPFEVTVGPSFRQMFDLAEEGALRSVLPSGQAGQVFQSHYADQTRLWLNGGYRTGSFSGSPGVETENLMLEPAQ